MATIQYSPPSLTGVTARNYFPNGTTSGAGQATINVYPPMSSFTPEDLSSLVVDLNADTVSGNDGDPIATWANQASTGSAADFTASGTARPLLKKNIINGKATLLGDGVNDIMTSTYNFPAGACTYFLVLKMVALPGAGSTVVPALLKTATPDHFKLLYIRNGVGGFQPWDIGAKAINNVDTGVGIADALDLNAHILSVAYNNGAHDAPGSYSITFDGTSKTVVASGALTVPTTYGNAIFAQDNGGGTAAPANMHIARLLCFNAVLSAADHTSVKDYLHTYYGI